jgi:hypothetical protein
MADKPIPTINGNRYSWASVEIDVGGVIINDITKVTYKAKKSRKTVYATGGIKPLGRTRGRLEFEASIEIRKESFNNLIARLGEGFMESTFQVVVNYQDAGNPCTTDTLVACQIDECGDDHSDGTDDLVVPITLHIMDILWNGVAATKSGKLS